MGAAVEPKDFGFPQEYDPSVPPTVVIREYPHIDFKPSPEYECKFAPKPHWFLRFYRMLRKLVRQRQESRVLKSEKRASLAQIKRADAAAEAAIENARLSSEATKRDAQAEIGNIRAAAVMESADFKKRLSAKDNELSELRQQMERRVGTLEEMLKSREKDIKSYADVQIPMLKNELNVAKMHIQHLELLHASKCALVETLNALLSKKIIDAESSVADSAKAMKELFSGQMGVSQSGG